MTRSVAGVIREGVVVPDAPLPEGERVEIILADQRPAFPPEHQEEFESWEGARQEVLALVERLATALPEGATGLPATGPEENGGEGSPARNAVEVIINRGCGPEIVGTRITVYDILDYVLLGWPPRSIAVFFRIGSEQVEAALQYLQEHKVEVIGSYARILERCAQGNAPEIQARLAGNRAKLLERVRRIRAGKAEETAHAGDTGRQ